MAATFVDRVALRAVEIHPLRVLLWVLAAPFWVVGATIAVVWVAVVWAWSAAVVGAGDVRERLARGGR